MRVRLKGLNHTRKRLADGSVRIYWFAWRGGPRLSGEPGSPEFIASFHEAHARARPAQPGVLSSVITAYQRSAAFRDLGERTREDYVRHIRVIERDFGDLPVGALKEQPARGVFREWRDRLGETSPRQADYAMMVLARILSWALDGGLVPANPCARAGRLYRANRADKVWTIDDQKAFLERAPKHLHLAFLLALHTGQREGDIVRLLIRAYDGKRILLLQRKSMRKGRRPVRVVIPVTGVLKAALDEAIKGRGVFEPILLTSHGKPWSQGGFRQSWRRACAAAGIVGVTFHDLRGTAVTRLALAGCTEAEIAAITGHSIRGVRSIMDENYLHRDPGLAESAIRKAESGTNSQTASQTGLECSGGAEPKNEPNHRRS